MRWEVRGRRSKVLSGAIAEIDRLMNDHGLDADDIISQLHDVLVGRRLSLPDELRSELLSALAICDTQIRSTMHARIPFENFLHKAAPLARSTALPSVNGGRGRIRTRGPARGQCIIQAMLHAHSGDRIPPRTLRVSNHRMNLKIEPRESSHVRRRTYMAGERSLPTPYAKESDRQVRQEQALSLRVKARDAGRRFG